MKNFLIHSNSWIFILACLVCSSCTHYYYAPEDGNLLALNEKGDLKASAAIGGTPSDTRNSMFSFQAGYSPLKNFAIQASYSDLNNFYERKRIGSIYMVSGAVGMYYFEDFKRLNESTPDHLSRQGILFDVYVGYGVGEVYNSYFGGGRSNFYFNKTYVQGGIHWQGKLIGISFATRFVSVDFDRGILSGNIDTPQWNAIELIQSNNPFFMVETSSRIHIGTKKIKFFFSQATVFPQLFDYRIDYLFKSFQIGLMADFDAIFEKKPTSKK